MIHIVDDFYVDVDDLNYTLCKRSDGIRNGEKIPVYKPLGYYNNLKSAVKGCVDRIRSRKLSEHDMELTQAIKVLQTADNVLESVLYRALGER